MQLSIVRTALERIYAMLKTSIKQILILFFCCVCVVVSVFLSCEEEKWKFSSKSFLLFRGVLCALCARVRALFGESAKKLRKKETLCCDEPRRDGLFVCSVLIASSEYG